MTTIEQLEALIGKLRSQPEARQRAAVDALREIAEEPYRLSAEELAVLGPARHEALRREHLTDADSDELLNSPWG
jgi:hypothetical protein